MWLDVDLRKDTKMTRVQKSLDYTLKIPNQSRSQHDWGTYMAT